MFHRLINHMKNVAKKLAVWGLAAWKSSVSVIYCLLVESNCQKKLTSTPLRWFSRSEQKFETILLTVRNKCATAVQTHNIAKGIQPVVTVLRAHYTWFVDCRLVDLRFVYTLNTKTSYSWLTKPKTPKLNAKTGGQSPQNPPKLFVAGYKQLMCINSRRIGCRRTGHNPSAQGPVAFAGKTFFSPHWKKFVV